jgi:hypothetical protein
VRGGVDHHEAAVNAAQELLIAAAGFAAGAINAIAGGGSLVSFPALVAAGLPTLTANVTNTVSVWPGYVSGAAGLRGELVGQRARMRPLAITACAGSALGVVLLLALPSSVFDAVVPWFVIFASVTLAVQPRVAAWLRARPRRRGDRAEHHAVGLHASLVAAAAYGAYFGGGLGVILLGVLGLFLTDGLHRVIALKNVMSFVVNTVALIAFVAFAPVDWHAFVFVAPAAFAGGLAGARLARLVPPAILRGAIIATGFVVGVVLLVR